MTFYKFSVTAVETMITLTEDERVRIECMRQEKAERDWINAMNYATEQGEERGMQMGIQKGIRQERENTLKLVAKMSQNGDTEYIARLLEPVNYVTLVRVLSTLHLNDTRVGIIMVFTSAMIPFCVFTIRNFVISVPVELDEAAVIDGAGPLSLFFKIIMPLLKPTMVTCFILQFMTVWSDFLTPLYLSSKSRLFPMTMAVYQFFGKNTNYWNYIFIIFF